MKSITSDAASDQEFDHDIDIDEKTGLVVQSYSKDDDTKMSDGRPWGLHASGRFLLRVFLLLLIFVLFT